MKFFFLLTVFFSSKTTKTKHVFNLCLQQTERKTRETYSCQKKRGNICKLALEYIFDFDNLTTTKIINVCVCYIGKIERIRFVVFFGGRKHVLSGAGDGKHNKKIWIYNPVILM